jgi:drug/metabolite transporter (DMT)-like permease
MSGVVLGAGAACAASSMYNLGVALQAIEARVVPADRGLRLSLVTCLARRPRWLAGTALGVLGWPLQAAALLLAPLTVVQPALAFGLVLLLALGARTLHERVGVRDVLAVAAIIAGVAWLAAVAPDASSHHAGGWPLVAALGVLAAIALAPYALRRRRRVDGIVAAISAGAAFAWSGLSTKFVADAAGAHHWAAAAGWMLATGLSSGVALLSEMTALQRRAATHVAPLVFVVQVAIPVLAAPLLTGESWAHAPLGPAGIVAGLAVVIGGAVVLTTARAVRSLVDADASSADSGTAVSPSAPSALAAASAWSADPVTVTTTMSPADGRAGSEREASKVRRPATGEASTLRPSRY